jgi:hypothetical protein
VHALSHSWFLIAKVRHQWRWYFFLSSCDKASISASFGWHDGSWASLKERVGNPAFLFSSPGGIPSIPSSPPGHSRIMTLLAFPRTPRGGAHISRLLPRKRFFFFWWRGWKCPDPSPLRVFLEEKPLSTPRWNAASVKHTYIIYYSLRFLILVRQIPNLRTANHPTYLLLFLSSKYHWRYTMRAFYAIPKSCSTMYEQLCGKMKPIKFTFLVQNHGKINLLGWNEGSIQQDTLLNGRK